MSYIIGKVIRREVYKEIFTLITEKKEKVTSETLLEIFKRKVSPEFLNKLQEAYGKECDRQIIYKLNHTEKNTLYTFKGSQKYLELNREHPWFQKMDPCDLIQDEMNEVIELPGDMTSLYLLANTFGIEPRELIYLASHSELKDYTYKKTFLSEDGVNFEAIMISKSAFFSWFDKNQWKKI